MSKILRVEIDPKSAAFEDSPEAEAWRLLQSVDADEVDSALTGGGAIELRDVNGNSCGSVAMIDKAEPQRLRGHTLLIGGDWVTLWPVEILGEGTFPPDNCSEPVVWFNHTESDWSEPYSIMAHCVVNRWGWAYSTHTAAELGLSDSVFYLDLKRRDREALMVCGSDNADRIRGKVTK